MAAIGLIGLLAAISSGFGHLPHRGCPAIDQQAQHQQQDRDHTEPDGHFLAHTAHEFHSRDENATYLAKIQRGDTVRIEGNRG